MPLCVLSLPQHTQSLSLFSCNSSGGSQVTVHRQQTSQLTDVPHHVSDGARASRPYSTFLPSWRFQDDEGMVRFQNNVAMTKAMWASENKKKPYSTRKSWQSDVAGLCRPLLRRTRKAMSVPLTVVKGGRSMYTPRQLCNTETTHTAAQQNERQDASVVRWRCWITRALTVLRRTRPFPVVPLPTETRPSMSCL